MSRTGADNRNNLVEWSRRKHVEYLRDVVESSGLSESGDAVLATFEESKDSAESDGHLKAYLRSRCQQYHDITRRYHQALHKLTFQDTLCQFYEDHDKEIMKLSDELETLRCTMEGNEAGDNEDLQRMLGEERHVLQDMMKHSKIENAGDWIDALLNEK